MAISRTLAQLRTAVRTRGEYNNSSVVTDTMLNELVNEAIEEVYAELVLKWEDYFTTEATLTTTAGVASVSLSSLSPAFFKLVRLDKLMSTGKYAKLHRYNVAEEAAMDDVWTGAYGNTYVYRLQQNTIQLRPLPESVDTLRILYVGQPTALAADGDSFDPYGVPGCTELVVQMTIYRLRVRDGESTADIEREIQRLWDRVNVWSASRTGDEAMLLPDNGRGGELL